jgi:hypothetical protein
LRSPTTFGGISSFSGPRSNSYARKTCTFPRFWDKCLQIALSALTARSSVWPFGKSTLSTLGLMGKRDVSLGVVHICDMTLDVASRHAIETTKVDAETRSRRSVGRFVGGAQTVLTRTWAGRLPNCPTISCQGVEKGRWLAVGRCRVRHALHDDRGLFKHGAGEADELTGADVVGVGDALGISSGAGPPVNSTTESASKWRATCVGRSRLDPARDVAHARRRPAVRSLQFVIVRGPSLLRAQRG